MNEVRKYSWGCSRKSKLGTLVFKDSDAKEVVLWKHIEVETKDDYIYLKSVLDKLGYIVQSVVLDARKGIEKAFLIFQDRCAISI